ncbi:M64 family metallopeptidase [Streptomyces sp. NPDC051020]|uniref:M64 family metallopeptidase n=1 Tax=Streptomyces sp. NPDC051020 TaxID=3155409 RepID=UPI003446A7F6
MAAATVAAAVMTALAVTPGSASAGAGPEATGRVKVEIPGHEHAESGEHGHHEAGSGYTWVPSAKGGPGARTSAPLSAAETRADGDVTKVIDNGPTADRLDVVVVGDGYTAAELDQFHIDAKEKWAEVTAVEPYTAYQNLFNVWTVDAVSNDSGVSGDPGRDVVKDTALGSYFWCGDIERLLCVDEQKVDSYVAKAPEADLVIVLSNSTKYGGAGYNTPSQKLGYEGISTASAGNDRSGQVAIHETGHSLGKLADEYFSAGTPGYEQYTGAEPWESNISTLSADAMAARQTKWYRWLGETSPDGGTVGAYQGGGYYEAGISRPTDASLMRFLGKPFNLPGREAMIAGFYRHASIATPVTPTDRTLRQLDTARVEVPRLAGEQQLDIQWYLDGKPLTAQAGRTAVPVAALHLDSRDVRSHRLTVVVTDRTDAVRDPAIAATLKDEQSWTVRH